MFDAVIIGAGINGTATAHFLTRAGLKVAIIDRDGIAKGGSGAAGAFISPKVSKSGPLKEIIEAAYLHALAFYRENFPEHIRLSPQLHIAKFADENEKVSFFKADTALETGDAPSDSADILQEFAQGFESVFIRHSGIVDAPKMCRALAAEATFVKEEITSLEYIGGLWQAGSVTARHVVLATGAYIPVIREPYMNVRAIWGHRIDIKTSSSIPYIIHHQVSLAPTDAKGCSAIGATHNVHYHPQLSDEEYDTQQGRAELIAKATGSVRLEDIEVLADYTGLRSGSNDYYPIVGRLVDSARSLQACPELLKGAKNPAETLEYYPDLYMINGSGGYGFVLAPYLAERLAAMITGGSEPDAALAPSRFFYRWAKRR